MESLIRKADGAALSGQMSGGWKRWRPTPSLPPSSSLQTAANHRYDKTHHCFELSGSLVFCIKPWQLFHQFMIQELIIQIFHSGGEWMGKLITVEHTMPTQRRNLKMHSGEKSNKCNQCAQTNNCWMGLAQTRQPMFFYYIPIHPTALTLSPKTQTFD